MYVIFRASSLVLSIFLYYLRLYIYVYTWNYDFRSVFELSSIFCSVFLFLSFLHSYIYHLSFYSWSLIYHTLLTLFGNTFLLWVLTKMTLTFPSSWLTFRRLTPDFTPVIALFLEYSLKKNLVIAYFSLPLSYVNLLSAPWQFYKPRTTYFSRMLKPFIWNIIIEIARVPIYQCLWEDGILTAIWSNYQTQIT